ncbi:putative effector protein [Aphelenchoides bicaudatus]|nr:putative effector protein [Aphelenchoides bicaudatus]
MDQKKECMEANVMGESTDDMKHCNWMDSLKYYAFSAHDSTMASLFATLGFPKTNYKSDGFPPYSACLAIELRKHHQTQEYYVKLNYIIGDTVTDVTADVEGCKTAECTLGEFTNRSLPYQIEDTKQFCAAPLPTLTDN